jgi:hypothetical protein
LPRELSVARLRVSHLPLDATSRHTDKYSDRYKLTTARFDVWSSNEELTTELLSYALAGASYVTRRGGQGSWNRGAGIMFSKSIRFLNWDDVDLKLLEERKGSLCCGVNFNRELPET